jgi:hypothetical protein
MRPIGIMLSASFSVPSSEVIHSFRGVSIHPGAMQFTRMFDDASSLATACVISLTPPLAAE